MYDHATVSLVLGPLTGASAGSPPMMPTIFHVTGSRRQKTNAYTETEVRLRLTIIPHSHLFLILSSSSLLSCSYSINHDDPLQLLSEAIGTYRRYHSRLPCADALLFAIECPYIHFSEETCTTRNLPWCCCLHSFA
jgi:hypothetical protein